MKTFSATAMAVVMLAPVSALGQEICINYGPQSPRDISSKAGANSDLFSLAPVSGEMNLCDIHTHTHAEHKGPGFTVSAGTGEHGGWRCNETDGLTEGELAPIEAHGDGAEQAGFGAVEPGDTIEVHWVYTTCDGGPAPGLESCFTETCSDPDLRVESQVFLVVNDETALDFRDFAHGGNMVGELHQPKALPKGTGDPVVYFGSTTGPTYNQLSCSPYRVTWSVRPSCAKIDINSLHAWADEGNAFEEDHSHGVRQLVTAPELLAPIN